MSLTLDNCIQIGTVFVATIGFILGYCQYRKAQRWKQSEFASREIERLLSNEVLVLACQMLDWEYGTYKIPMKFKDTKNKEPDFACSWEMYERAMHSSVHGPDDSGYNEEERYCRVIFDELFTFLDLLNHYVSVNLIKIEDIKPAEYWVNQIFESELATNKSLFRPFLIKFGYNGVIDERFKRSNKTFILKNRVTNKLRRLWKNLNLQTMICMR